MGTSPKMLALHAEETDLVVLLPGHPVAGADVDVFRGEPLARLGLHGLRLGDALRFQAAAVQHVEEVRVAPRVELVGPLELHAPHVEQVCEHPVDDGGPELALDVVADDGKALLFEALCPLGVAGDEDGDVVDEADACLEGAARVKPRRFFGPCRQVVEQDLSPRIPQGSHHVLLRGLLLLCGHEGKPGVVLAHVGGDAVEHLSHRNPGPCFRDPGLENGGAVGGLENGLGDVFSDFAAVDVKGADHLDVGGPVAAEIPVHQADPVFR